MTAEPRTMSAGEVQLCPKCRIPMSVSDVIPTMPTTGLDEDEVVYRCHRCGAEVKRILERPGSCPNVFAGYSPLSFNRHSQIARIRAERTGRTTCLIWVSVRELDQLAS